VCDIAGRWLTWLISSKLGIIKIIFILLRTHMNFINQEAYKSSNKFVDIKTKPCQLKLKHSVMMERKSVFYRLHNITYH